MDEDLSESLRDALLDLAEVVLRGSPAVCRLAAAHRAKFEHWMKFALAETIDSGTSGVFSLVDLEASMPLGDRKSHIDMVLEASGVTCLVELKTCNTNWRCAGCENLTRPITKNIGDIIKDRDDLRRIVGQGRQIGFVLFAMFPVPNAQAESYARFLTEMERARSDGGMQAPANASSAPRRGSNAQWLISPERARSDETVQYHVGRIVDDDWAGTLLHHRVIDGFMDSCSVLAFCLPIVPSPTT